MSVVLESQVTLVAPEEPSGWHKAVQSIALPRSSYTVVFHVNNRGWGVVLSYQDSGAHWLVSSANGTGIVSITKYNPATGLYEPCAGTGSESIPFDNSDIKVSFREMRFGDSSTTPFYTIGLWANGRHILSHSEPALTPLPTTVRFGLAVPAGQTRTFANLRIPELSTFVDWLSIDPGETPMGGLQRAIEGQHVRFFMRFNGALRVWRPKPTSVARTYTDIADRQIEVDTRGLKTHIRMIGGYAQAEVHRQDLTQKYGHRFDEMNNPFLLTEQECRDQAIIAIRRLEEAVETESFTAEYNPLIEPEDRIETPGGHQRLVSARSVTYDQSTGIDNLSTRSYVYSDDE